MSGASRRDLFEGDTKGKPDFNLNFYAVNREGEHAGAAVWSGSYGGSGQLTPSRYAVADASGARLRESAYLYKRAKP